MIYTEHEFANKLNDVSISEYIPIWNRNTGSQQRTYPIKKENTTKDKKIEKNKK